MKRKYFDRELLNPDNTIHYTKGDIYIYMCVKKKTKREIFYVFLQFLYIGVECEIGRCDIYLNFCFFFCLIIIITQILIYRLK